MKFKVGEKAIYHGMFKSATCTIVRVYSSTYVIEFQGEDKVWCYASDDNLTKINISIR